MRIACIRVPSFAVAVERKANPSLAGQPLVVIDGKTVLDASADVTDVHHGLSARHAKALRPDATFIQANHARYRGAFGAMLDTLERFIPEVEPACLGCAYADILGLGEHYQDEFALAGTLVDAVRDATGLLPSVGIADRKFVASVAASIAEPGDAGIVPSGREQEFLQDRPVVLLPCDSDIHQRLDLLALRTLGDVATLPRSSLEAQFGRAKGERLWELANGIDQEQIQPRKPQEVITEFLSFDVPVVATEVLLAAGTRIVSRIMRRLEGRVARRMRLHLIADELIVWKRLETFREPTGDAGRMLPSLKTRLSVLELSEAVDTISITLSGIGQEVAKQAKLFTDTQQNLNQIGEAIRQLRARYGRDIVGRVMEVDPWSRHPEERTILVPYDT